MNAEARLMSVDHNGQSVVVVRTEDFENVIREKSWNLRTVFIDGSENFDENLHTNSVKIYRFGDLENPSNAQLCSDNRKLTCRVGISTQVS